MFIGDRALPGPGDEAWSSWDRAAAIAWQADQADVCSGCGHRLSESMAPEAEDDYEAHLLVCHACATRGRKAQAIENASPGAYISVTRG